MRELRSSTVSAREKSEAAEGGSRKKSPIRSKKEESPSGLPRGFKTRGRIKATAMSKSPSTQEGQEDKETGSTSKEKPEEEDDEEENTETGEAGNELTQEGVDQEKESVMQKPAEPSDEKETMADKENELSSTGPDEKETSSDEKAKTVPSDSRKRKVADDALEEEADEDSASEIKNTTPAASNDDKASSKKDETKPKKNRPVYDQETVDKAANSVIEGKMGTKKAAEEFGLSRSAVERRVRVLRGLPTRKRQEAVKVQVIRVEDLD